MPSNSGSQEPQLPDPFHISLTPENRRRLVEWGDDRRRSQTAADLTEAEALAVANGESYCFLCGRPASSFSAYDTFEDEEKEVPGSRDAYVRREEGTYNPATNRFACDGCYIIIGMPSGPNGWTAP
jgi:hypothetical protein